MQHAYFAMVFSCETFASDLIPLCSPLHVHWTDGKWQAAVDELQLRDYDCMMECQGKGLGGGGVKGNLPATHPKELQFPHTVMSHCNLG